MARRHLGVNIGNETSSTKQLGVRSCTQSPPSLLKRSWNRGRLPQTGPVLQIVVTAVEPKPDRNKDKLKKNQHRSNFLLE